MSDSQEYRRKLASGQNMAATTQEYKMAQDREKILKALNGKYKDRDDLSDEQIANSIQRDNPDLSMDVITKTVSSNRPKNNLRDKGYPSSSDGTGAAGSEPKNLRDLGYPSAAGNPGTYTPQNQFNSQGYPTTTQYPAQDSKSDDDKKADSTSDNTPVVNNPTKPADNTQQPAQNQGQINSNYYTQYYGHDIHNNGAIPFQGKKKDGDNEKDEGEGDEKDKTGSLKRFSLLGNVFGSRNPNNVLFDRRDMMRNLADEATNEAATHGMEAQGWQQIANRNPYSEASKYASATNAQQIAANVTANSAKGGDQIGLSRVNNPMDINTQDQKAMDARLKAETPRQKQLNAQGQSTAYLGEAQQLNTQGRNLSADELESRRLSLGNGTGTSTGEGETKEKTEETTEETPVEETPTEENQPEPQPVINYNAQNIINALLGSTKGQDLRNGKGDENDLKMYNWIISQGIKPITPVSADPNAWESEFISKYGDKGKNVMTMLREGRSPSNAERNFAPSEHDQMREKTPFDLNDGTQFNGYACGTKNAKPGYAIVGENGPEIVKMNGGEVVIPNNDDIDRIVSDERVKYIKECLDLGLGMTPEDFRWLAKKQGGKFNFNGKDYDWFKDEDWEEDTDDSVLNGYADHIKNYLYTYKPEAQKIDKSIDPEQEHIGPMAQDIEKVNPACIVETSEGVKTVDTGRLAMMNAGAIGDLARQLRELKEVFING